MQRAATVRKLMLRVRVVAIAGILQAIVVAMFAYIRYQVDGPYRLHSIWIVDAAIAAVTLGLSAGVFFKLRFAAVTLLVIACIDIVLGVKGQAWLAVGFSGLFALAFYDGVRALTSLRRLPSAMPPPPPVVADEAGAS